MEKDRYREGWNKGYQQCKLDMTDNSKSALSDRVSLPFANLKDACRFTGVALKDQCYKRGAGENFKVVDCIAENCQLIDKAS